MVNRFSIKPCANQWVKASQWVKKSFFLINDVGTTRHMFGKAILLVKYKYLVKIYIHDGL